MCGIAGYYSLRSHCSETDLERMTSVLNHRGPDAEGYYCNEHTGLGHKRLSILDLSAEANQPMFSRCGNYVIVYNGEVYNFKELAQSIGYQPKTGSDTEIIVEAFARLGKDFVRQLNGMFAFAICNIQSGALYLARDRVGIKPLYYYRDENVFLFASELKALMQAKYVRERQEINREAIPYYLHLGYIPEPYTIYRNINKFPAGAYAVMENNKPEFTYYWNAGEQFTRNVITDESIALKELEQLLVDAVKKRLISDVPYGIFLSGGTDSSLVTAIAQSVGKKQMKTFTIGFREEQFNESEYAKKIAAYLGTDHHEFIVSHNDAIDLLDDITGTYDEPYADSSAIPTMLVSKTARQHVKMVLTGDGGDELFYGYGSYIWARRLANPLFQLFRHPLYLGFSMLNQRFQRGALLFNYPDKANRNSHIFSQEQHLFSFPEIQKLISQPIAGKTFDFPRISNPGRSLNSMEKQAFFDFNYYLRDDLLVKTDRASMKFALEARVPLLDHRIAEFAFNLHHKLKLKNKTGKYLLKKLLYKYVPEEFFRRPKWGFAIPLSKWLHHELKYLQEEYLSESVVNKYDIIPYESVKRVLTRFNQKSYYYNRVWALIVLFKWMEENAG